MSNKKETEQSNLPSSHDECIPSDLSPIVSSDGNNNNKGSATEKSITGGTAHDTWQTPCPEILHDDDTHMSVPVPLIPLPEATKGSTGKPARETGIEDIKAQGESSSPHELFRGAQAKSFENGASQQENVTATYHDSILVEGKDEEETSRSSEVDNSSRNGHSPGDTGMDIVNIPPPTRQDSLLPHVPTAFLVEHQPSTMTIYDAVHVPDEPWWRKHRIGVAIAFVASLCIVLLTVLLLTEDSSAPTALGSPASDGWVQTGADDSIVASTMRPAVFPVSMTPTMHPPSSAQAMTMPSSASSSCYPLAFQEALIQDGTCIVCGVQVAASNDQAVVTVGSEVRFYHRTNVGWERHPDSFYLPADTLRTSISASGSVVAVGAYRENNEAGSAYVFEKSGDDDDSGWRQSTQLVPLTDALTDGDRFGWSVDIDEDRILIGAEGRSGGAAYLFQQGEDGTWSQEASIYPNYSYPQVFGSTVALAGNTLAVADVFDPTVFIYAYNESLKIWGVSQEISNADCDARFGRSIALYEEGLAIGCDWDDYSAGAVYYYELTSSASIFGEYVLKQKLTASDRAPSNVFGCSNSVRMEGNIMTIGSFGAPNGSKNGRVYIFERPAPGEAWSQIANISSPNEEPADQFGQWITLAGRHVLVGSVTNAYSYELKDCQVLS